jgi:hypothetical protein
LSGLQHHRPGGGARPDQAVELRAHPAVPVIKRLTTSPTVIGLRQARRLGVGTAAVLAAIDLVYVPARRISKMYLVDAAIEVGWIMAWCRVDKPAKGR